MPQNRWLSAGAVGILRTSFTNCKNGKRSGYAGGEGEEGGPFNGGIFQEEVGGEAEAHESGKTSETQGFRDGSEGGSPEGAG
ncbi:MAG TPA: hypothetical protein VGF40_16620 [Thermoanaerobaculia bacterium]